MSSLALPPTRLVWYTDCRDDETRSDAAAERLSDTENNEIHATP